MRNYAEQLMLAENPLTPNEMNEISSLMNAYLSEMEELEGKGEEGLIDASNMMRHHRLLGRVEAIQDILGTYDGERQKQEEMDRSPRHKELVEEYVKSQSKSSLKPNPRKLTRKQKKDIAFYAAWNEESGVPRGKAIKMAYAFVLKNPLTSTIRRLIRAKFNLIGWSKDKSEINDIIRVEKESGQKKKYRVLYDKVRDTYLLYAKGD